MSDNHHDIDTALDALQSGLADLDHDDIAPVLDSLDTLAALFEEATKDNLDALARLNAEQETSLLEHWWRRSSRPRS